MIRFLTLLLIVGSALTAHAQSCGSVDLRTTPGGRAMGPVRNQGDLPWCISYVFADLASYRTRQRYSAVAMGINTNNYIEGEKGIRQTMRNLWNGTSAVTVYHPTNFRQAFDGNKRALQCLESDLPSNDNGNFQVMARIRELAEIKKNYDETHACTQAQLRTIQTFFPKAKPKAILDILHHSYKADFHTALYRANCAERNLRMPDVRTGSSNDPNTIDQQLDAGNPVAINYGSNVLKKLDTSSKFGHASTVVGRRMRAGKCEYLVRNSWGRSCRSYDKRLPCEEGNIWVPGDKLKEVTGVVVYLR
jgi:hypothetical protein